MSSEQNVHLKRTPAKSQLKKNIIGSNKAKLVFFSSKKWTKLRKKTFFF